MPRHARAGRRELFRAYLRGRAAVYASVLGGGGAFLYCAYRRDLLIMVAAPAAVMALVTLVAAAAAHRAAERRFFEAVARSLGLTYVGRAVLLPLTPLLGAGNRQWLEHWMQGALSREPALAGGLGQFVFEVRRGRRGLDGIRREVPVNRQRLFICVIEMDPSIARFKGVFLRPVRGIFDAEDWLSGRGRSIELESGEFSERYELLVADDQSETTARELLSPSLVDWLARHPLVPGFELKAGTLVVFVRRRLEDAGQLELFLEAARHLAQRVLDELPEAAERSHARAGAGPGGPASDRRVARGSTGPP